MYILIKYKQKDEITAELSKIISNTEQFISMFKLIELYRDTYKFFIDLTDVNKKCLELVRLFTIFTKEIMPSNDVEKNQMIDDLTKFNSDIDNVEESIKSIQIPIASQPVGEVSIIKKFINGAKLSFTIISGKPKEMLVNIKSEFSSLILYFTILLGQTFLQLNIYQHLETYEYNQNKIKEIINSEVYDKFLFKSLLKIFEELTIFSNNITDSEQQKADNNKKFIEILTICYSQVSLFYKSLKPGDRLYEGAIVLLASVNNTLNIWEKNA